MLKKLPFDTSKHLELNLDFNYDFVHTTAAHLEYGMTLLRVGYPFTPIDDYAKDGTEELFT